MGRQRIQGDKMSKDGGREIYRNLELGNGGRIRGRIRNRMRGGGKRGEKLRLQYKEK